MSEFLNDTIITDGTDKILVCKDCFTEFAFTAGEQEFYKEHDFVEPKRCPECRRARKTNRNQQA